MSNPDGMRRYRRGSWMIVLGVAVATTLALPLPTADARHREGHVRGGDGGVDKQETYCVYTVDSAMGNCGPVEEGGTVYLEQEPGTTCPTTPCAFRVQSISSACGTSLTLVEQGEVEFGKGGHKLSGSWVTIDECML